DCSNFVALSVIFVDDIIGNGNRDCSVVLR
ncbi:hypothetical protein MIMGU_mgv1a0214171mg, partial [Erythranthe guttata]